MIEAEGHIASPSSKRNKLVGCAFDAFLCLCEHGGICVAGFIYRHLIDELSGRGAIFVDLGYIRTVFYLFVHYVYFGGNGESTVVAVDAQGERICSLLSLKEDV